MNRNPHSFARKILKIGAVVIMAAVTLTSLFGCSQKDDIAGTVEKNLETKYHEKFVVSKVYGGSLVPTNVFADTHKLVCYPEKNPSLKFKAELSPNGVFFDEYVSANVNVKVEKIISDALKKQFSDVAVKSVGVGTYLDSANKDMSIEEYLNDKDTNGFNIHIVIQTDTANSSNVYNTTLEAMRTIKNFDACAHCYFVSQSDFISCINSFEQNIEINSDQIKNISKSVKYVKFNYSKESVNKTSEMFTSELEKGED